MKTYVEEDELAHSDTEITLGTRSILGIFFGLALICGVFFGFGYSVGRANIGRAAASIKTLSQPSSSEPSSAVQTVVDDSASSTPDNSGVEQNQNISASGSSIPKPSGALAEPPAAAAPAPQQSSIDSAATAPESRLAESASSPLAPTQPKAAPVSYSPQTSASPAEAIMVQIAAVSRHSDADVLVAALAKLGFQASIRTSAADPLLHVQMGPFATREQARAMRTRLLNDGYNAILK